MAELIKKCPFCGGEAKITCVSNYGGIETISCKKCHVDIRRVWCKDTPLESEVNVLESWNNRVTEAEIRNKAIDEFAEEILKNSQTANRSVFNRDYTIIIHKSVIDEIAEQLKGE